MGKLVVSVSAPSRVSSVKRGAAEADMASPLPQSQTLSGEYVFISYGSVDRERVLPIVRALTKEGIQVWIDLRNIAGGANYGTQIAHAIRGCSALIVACSSAALQSRNVKQEIQLAWKYQRPYLPILLEPTEIPEEFEYWLEGWQWIDVCGRPDNEWLPEVLRALRKLLPVYAMKAAASPAGAAPVASVTSPVAPSSAPPAESVGRPAAAAAPVPAKSAPPSPATTPAPERNYDDEMTIILPSPRRREAVRESVRTEAVSPPQSAPLPMPVMILIGVLLVAVVILGILLMAFR